MAEYKCICCGETKDSQGACSCPLCGHRMFELPYNRADVLLSEIECFISSLEVRSITRDDLVFEGKSKDDSRFPDYDKILKYVSTKDRTEDFLNCLLKTIEQLKLHFTSSFSNTYPVSFENVDAKIIQTDAVLISAANVLIPGATVKLEAISWPQVSVLYRESQNKYLWFSANDLLFLIEKLANKIVKFIKMNNLYGDIHKYSPHKRKNKDGEKIDYKDELENAIFKTEEIVNKKYFIDILDDGSAELKEMLACLWHGIELIMCAPLFIKSYDYITEAGSISESDMFDKISAMLADRYESLNSLIKSRVLHLNKAEDTLFEMYEKLIEIDKFKVLTPAGAALISVKKSEKKLNELIGLSSIKESVMKIKAYALANKDNHRLNIHMCFLGNPGSGKTEVARCISNILYQNGILKTNIFVEVDRSGLVSQYFGSTAEKTANVIESAMGGVLFIDEAYSLFDSSSNNISDYGKEAIDTLVKAMEDHRGEFCVIFAGYRNEMQKMLSANPGLKSRIQFMLDFPNYSRDELHDIAMLMLKKQNYVISRDAMNKILDITDIKRKEPNFANAREIRNILDQVIMCQNLRCIGTDDNELGIVDVNKYIADNRIVLPTGAGDATKKILTGEEELDNLIGLASVKRMVKKIKAYAKRNKDDSDSNIHMCFYGNPGTGKTEVARIISRILYASGVLDEAKLVETNAQGLLGKFVGQTGPKTEEKVKEAMGGVLFIDEAYGLLGTNSADGNSSCYGDEAITVLLKEMEDHRGQFCVILAGYKDEMQRLLSANPGFESRIQFTLDFPDYSKDELREIAKIFLAKKKYEIEPNALNMLLDITEYYRNRPNFANARTLRNIVEQVIMNQNLRTEDIPTDNTIILSDLEDYIADENIDLASISSTAKHIGFV